MKALSRRQFLYISAFFSFTRPLSVAAAFSGENKLKKAAEKELEKIKKTYPNFLAKMEKESHDQAVINCMYSWKSHRQHEQKINEIIIYSNMFFGSVAKKIEGMKLDFHICEICGATIDESPQTPCDICNYPVYHYQKVNPPI